MVGAFLYFRPVLCSIPAYRSIGPISAGTTVPIGTPISPGVCTAANAAENSSTPPFNDAPTATVILPYYDNSLRYVLGPADINGSAIVTTSVVGAQSGGFQVELTLTDAGATEFDHVVSERYPFYAADPSSPPFQSLEAIELNGTVVSARAIEAQTFGGNVTIGGSTAAPLSKKKPMVLSRTSSSREVSLRRDPKGLHAGETTAGSLGCTWPGRRTQAYHLVHSGCSA